MKKLSATFKRTKSQMSQGNNSTANLDDTSSRGSSGGGGNAQSTTKDTLAQLTNAYQRVLQEQNRQVQELERLRSMTSNPAAPEAPVASGKPPKAPAPRAKTFNNGTGSTYPPLPPMNMHMSNMGIPAGMNMHMAPRVSNAENVIPFFQQNHNININNTLAKSASSTDSPSVLSVPGTPVWQAKKLKNKHKQRNRKKYNNSNNAMQYFNSHSNTATANGNPHISRPTPTRRQVTAPSYDPTPATGYVLEYDRVPSRNRQRSFSIGEVALDSSDGSEANYNYNSRSSLDNPRPRNRGSRSDRDTNRNGLSNRAIRLASGKRWKMPRMSVEGVALPYKSLPGGSRDTILQRRDRVEALPLASACAHLEAEIYRLRGVHNSTACCNETTSNSKGESANAECPHRVATAETIEKLTDMLVMLEDRFDTIEQFYVKGKEYARAMGKFYNVSPNEYNKWVEQRSGAPKSTRVR